MVFVQPSVRSLKLVSALVLLLLPAVLLAADKSAPRRKSVPKPGEFNPEHKSVDMFKAMEAGQIDVKIIPKNSKRSQVLIENKTDQPLNIKLPEAFAGVPVLAQIGGVGGAGIGNRGGNSGAQAFGGGMGGMGMGGMGGGGMGGMGGGGMGMFNIAPEKVGKLKVTTVCLEHGKAEPRPAIQYEIKPVEAYTDKAEVQELCRLLGTGKINQRAAQVSAWHLNNGMTFQQLAAKRLKFANGTSQPYFSLQEIQAGMQITAMATKLAKQRQQSPGKSHSLSQK